MKRFKAALLQLDSMSSDTALQAVKQAIRPSTCWNYGSLLEWWLYYWNDGYTIEKVAYYWNGDYTIGMVAILLK